MKDLNKQLQRKSKLPINIGKDAQKQSSGKLKLEPQDTINHLPGFEN